MALFNYASRELSAKIVYYGPGLSGKTTNIEMVHKLLRPEQKGRLISLPTETDRTLFFDFLPLDLGEIKGFKVRFHLYTVPGQVFYNATRRLVLQGVDGVVFVADSQSSMMDSNAESLKNLVDNLTTYGKKLKDLPFVMQFNKRDLKNIASVEEMSARLNTMRVPVYEGVAKDGTGVTETLVAVSRMVFTHLRKTLLMPGDAVEPDPGMLGGAASGKSGGRKEAESIEEIDIEEITEGAAGPEDSAPAPPEGEPRSEFSFEGLGEIEIELPESAADSAAESAPEGAAEKAPESVPELGPESAPGGGPAILREFPGAAAGGAAPAAATGFPTSVSVEAEGGGLRFIKFENVFVSTEGFVMLPAVFMDASGNPVKIRIRISVEEDRG